MRSVQEPIRVNTRLDMDAVKDAEEGRSRMPPKRRGYRTGSVSSKPRSDGMWIATIEAGLTASGARRRIRLAAKTKREVEVKLKNKLREIDASGLPEEGVGVRDTVKMWAEEWLAIIEHDLAPNTLKTNIGIVRKWIIPTIGHKRLSLLTPADLRAVADAQRKVKPPRKASSILRTHAVLAKMLKSALVDGGHKINPRILVMGRPRKNESDRGEIPLPDALAILRAAGDHPDGSRWLAQLLQGIRQAEALGLTWDRVLNLDTPDASLDISWQLQSLPYKHGCTTPCGQRPASCPAREFRVPDGFRARQLHKALHLTKPKTEKGKREIPLIAPMAAALRAWRTMAPPNPHHLVWARIDEGRATGQPRTAHFDNDQWTALQDAAGVRHPDGRYYGTHELRHTAATMLRSAGANDETIKAILGHATILSTKAYLHVDMTQARAALEAVGQRLQLS